MSEATDPLAWAEKAEEDLTVVRFSLRRKDPLTPMACFHAQQAAEKYLKAALVARTVVVPKTHDLVLLNRLCADVGFISGIHEDDLDVLSMQAVKARYPGDAPTLEDAREALATAKLVRQVTRGWLGLT